jgi:hypothetical protein
VVVVVNVDLLAREELLVRELGRRAPFTGGCPGALLAEETPKPSKELLARDLLPAAYSALPSPRKSPEKSSRSRQSSGRSRTTETRAEPFTPSTL